MSTDKSCLSFNEAIEPLLGDQDEGKFPQDTLRSHQKDIRRHLQWYRISMIVLLPTCFFAGGLTSHFLGWPPRVMDQATRDHSNLPYSPVNHLLEYVRRPAWDEDAHFPWANPPSLETDAAWEELLAAQNIAIPKDELDRQNENLTNAVVLSNGDYVGMLGVWHQLHCLQIFHHAVYWDSYKAKLHEQYSHERLEESFSEEHYNHCLDLLGRAILCQPDLSLWSVEWIGSNDDVLGKRVRSSGEKECVNFDLINQWALPRALQEGYKVRPGPFENQPHEDHSYASSKGDPITRLGRIGG